MQQEEEADQTGHLSMRTDNNYEQQQQPLVHEMHQLRMEGEAY